MAAMAYNHFIETALAPSGSNRSLMERCNLRLHFKHRGSERALVVLQSRQTTNKCPRHCSQRCTPGGLGWVHFAQTIGPVDTGTGIAARSDAADLPSE